LSPQSHGDDALLECEFSQAAFSAKLEHAMTMEPTATLRVEWRTDKRLTVRVVPAIDQDGRLVALNVLSVTPDPVAEMDPERKLLNLARRAVVQAELVNSCRNGLAEVSRDAARNAHKDVVEAIELLQALELSLNDHINE
jgi:hypothetical protein